MKRQWLSRNRIVGYQGIGLFFVYIFWSSLLSLKISAIETKEENLNKSLRLLRGLSLSNRLENSNESFLEIRKDKEETIINKDEEDPLSLSSSTAASSYNQNILYINYLKEILEKEKEFDSTVDNYYTLTLQGLLEAFNSEENNNNNNNNNKIMVDESIEEKKSFSFVEEKGGRAGAKKGKSAINLKNITKRSSLGEIYTTLIALFLENNGVGNCAWPLKITAGTTTAFMTDLESGYQVLTLPFSGLDLINDDNNTSSRRNSNNTIIENIEYRLSARYPQVNYFSYQSYDLDGEPFSDIIDMSIKAEKESQIYEDVYIDLSNEMEGSDTKERMSPEEKDYDYYNFNNQTNYMNRLANMKKIPIFVEEKMNPYNSMEIKSPLQSGKFYLYLSPNISMLDTYRHQSKKNVLPVSVFYLPRLDRYISNIFLRFYGQDPSIIPKPLKTNDNNNNNNNNKNKGGENVEQITTLIDRNKLQTGQQTRKLLFDYILSWLSHEENESSNWMYADDFENKDILYLGKLYEKSYNQEKKEYRKRKYSLNDMEIFQMVDSKFKDWGWVDIPKIEYRLIDQEKYNDYLQNKNKIKFKADKEEAEEVLEKESDYFTTGWREYLPCQEKQRNSISKILGDFLTNQIFATLKSLTTEAKRKTCGDSSVEGTKNFTTILFEARKSNGKKRNSVAGNLDDNLGSNEITRDIMLSEKFFFAHKNSSYDYMTSIKFWKDKMPSESENHVGSFGELNEKDGSSLPLSLSSLSSSSLSDTSSSLSLLSLASSTSTSSSASTSSLESTSASSSMAVNKEPKQILYQKIEEQTNHKKINDEESILYSVQDHFSLFAGNDELNPDAKIPYVNENANYLGWCGTTNSLDKEGETSLSPSPNLVIKLELTLPSVARGLYPFYGGKLSEMIMTTDTETTDFQQRTTDITEDVINEFGVADIVEDIVDEIDGAHDTVEDIVNEVEEISNTIEGAFSNKERLQGMEWNFIANISSYEIRYASLMATDTINPKLTYNSISVLRILQQLEEEYHYPVNYNTPTNVTIYFYLHPSMAQICKIPKEGVPTEGNDVSSPIIHIPYMTISEEEKINYDKNDYFQYKHIKSKSTMDSKKQSVPNFEKYNRKVKTENNFFIPVSPQVQAIVYRQLLSRHQIEDIISPLKEPSNNIVLNKGNNSTEVLRENCTYCQNSIYSIEKYCKLNQDQCEKENLKDLSVLKGMMAEFYPRGEIFTCDPFHGQLLYKEKF